MKQFTIGCLLLWLGLTSAVARPSVTDSVRVERKGGKKFIVHRVEQGQTLFSIARRYRTTAAAITGANPELTPNKGVRYDQLVRVPMPDPRPAAPKNPADAPAEPTASGKPTKPASTSTPPVAARLPDLEPLPADGIHVVGTGQTLYNIAARYGLSQSDLRRWNNIADDNVRLGEPLIVTERAYQDRQPTAPRPTPKTVVAAITPKPDAPAKPDVPAPAPGPAPTPAPAPTIKPAPTTIIKSDDESVIRPGTNAPLPTVGRRISETGLAELIDDSQGSAKFLALHRTAPVGTLVLVRNDENNQSIWVKVIGRIPDTGVNDNVLIKLSSRAFARLGTTDRRFRAEVSYLAP